MRKERYNKYNILSTNCDCSSDRIAVTTTHYKYGPRCPSCGRILGPMQYMYLGTVKARGDIEALRIFRQQSRDQAKEGE